MKMLFSFVTIIFILPTFIIRAQGTFIYDQQSAIEGASAEGGGIIPDQEPFGQSFTPTLFSVGFIRLEVGDFNSGNSLGATLYVNLRANSITGTILAVSSIVSMSDSSEGYIDFIFTNPASVTPGVTYYFQPVVELGDTWVVAGDNYNYPGGSAYRNGQPSSVTQFDLWFREGIVVSEPSASWLVLIGSGIFFYARRFYKSH